MVVISNLKIYFNFIHNNKYFRDRRSPDFQGEVYTTTKSVRSIGLLEYTSIQHFGPELGVGLRPKSGRGGIVCLSFKFQYPIL